MKKFLSVIMAVGLVTAVSASVASGTLGGFYDTEVSTGSYMCAGSRTLELSGGPLIVKDAWPSSWFKEDYTLINTGTLSGCAYIHIPKLNDPSGNWEGLKCFEGGTVKGQVWDGSDYRLPAGSEPVGSGVATTEPELVAEQGGIAGENRYGQPVCVPGIGVDKRNIADYIDVKIYFEDVLKVSGKLSTIACTEWYLGSIPASSSYTWTKNGGGWGSYFSYKINGTVKEMVLMAGRTVPVGTVRVWNDLTNLYVRYDITVPGYYMKETHLYTGKYPPSALAPGQFPWKHENLPNVTSDFYTIPLSAINGNGGVVAGNTIYIAAHASNAETYWAQGESRRVKIKMHFPDVDEDCLGYHYFNECIPAEAKWDHWPTDAYMGDYCTFDIKFRLK